MLFREHLATLVAGSTTCDKHSLSETFGRMELHDERHFFQTVKKFFSIFFQAVKKSEN
jgi:hypothetical protein